MRQGIVASEEDNDMTYFEITDLDTHANMAVPGRKCYIVNHPGKIVVVHPFSSECEVLKVPIVDAVMKCDGP